MKNNTIIKSLYNSALHSQIGLIDINADRFFGELIKSEVPFDGDILSYVEDLTTNAYYESPYKMIITNGRVMKTDIDVMEAMIDTEDVLYGSYYTFDTFDDLMNYYYTKCNYNYIYSVSKEMDSCDGKEFFLLSRLVKED